MRTQGTPRLQQYSRKPPKPDWKQQVAGILCWAAWLTGGHRWGNWGYWSMLARKRGLRTRQCFRCGTTQEQAPYRTSLNSGQR